VSFLDVKTVFTGSVVTSALCVVVLASLWIQNRRRSPEIVLWLIDASAYFVALVLIMMRGVAPDFLSIVVANVLIVGGAVILLEGLRRYVGVRGPHWHNYLMLAVFTLIHLYFTYARPSLEWRTVNAALGLAFVSVQIAWLMLYGVDGTMRSATRATGVVFVGFSLVAMAHAITSFQEPMLTSLFKSGAADALAYLTDQLLFVALTFSLALMVSRRLLTALEVDIAERQVAQEALRKSEIKFSAAFHTVPDAILVTHIEDGSVVDLNGGCLRLTGLTREEALGRTTVGLGLWADVGDRERYVEELDGHGRVADFECVLKKKSGETYPAIMDAELMDVDGERLLLTVFRDATESKLANDQLLSLSNHDPLTGILNYRAFYAAATERLARMTDAHAALIFLDLDGLKSINDDYGHQAGDMALVAFADVLMDTFRESDTVGRVGGDEFAVLVASRDDVSDDALMARFTERLHAANESSDWPFRLSASAGIAWRGESNIYELRELISVADTRMYEAKHARRAPLGLAPDMDMRA
jgi:diguanylate cyclase (GGDEF)-like protein/PAS domain S-box-containing protein